MLLGVGVAGTVVSTALRPPILPNPPLIERGEEV
jgi:hypothetical protein